jgi:EmrB/QacA subfamily drug resistance transporter
VTDRVDTTPDTRPAQEDPGDGSAPTAGHAAARDPRRWAALAVIAIAQLMIVLDATIVNIALPQAQQALAISDVDRQWIITAYTLAFGGFLLFFGRVADFTGRKRAFMIGLVGFAVASAVGGLATEAWVLFLARALQGVFGALMAPAALSLLTVTFTDPRERARAFGVFGAIAGAGAAIGLLLGGVLTEFASWRWTLGVNVPISLVAVAAAVWAIRESRAEGATRYDVPGIVLATAGLMSLVYGFAEAEDGWTAPSTLLFLGLGVALLAAFVVVEARSTHPLLPFRVVLDRSRGGAFLTFLLVGAGLFAMFLFLTLYFQLARGWSPLDTGFAFLPFAGTLIVMAGVVAQLLPRVGPRPLMVTGLGLAVAGMLLLLRIDLDSSYLVDIMPAQLIMGIGMSLVFIPASATALSGVHPDDSGVASATLNTAQQIGGSIGTALLTTVYVDAADDFRLANAAAREFGTPAFLQAEISGYHHAFAWGAGLLAVALLVAAVLITAGPSRVSAEQVPVAG